MKAIVLPRVRGKTQRMLAWLASHHTHVLVVMSARERDRLKRLFVGAEADRIVSIGDVERGALRGRWPSPVYGIDELDQVLAQILGGHVEVVSFTGVVES